MDQRPSGRIEKVFPGLASLLRYDRSWLPNDLLAGVSVAAVAVPIAIAYSQLAGVPAVNGLYASILPLVAYAIFGTSRQLILAPDAATCAVVATIVAPLAAGNPDRIIPLTMVLSVITGVFCIIAGVARLGFLTNFLARPILTGYLNGIALSIISGQLGKLFGFSVASAGFFRLLWRFFARLGQTHWLTLAIGLGTFALLRVLKVLVPKIPSPLVAVALGIAASYFFHLGEHSVAILGSIPAGLPPLLIPKIGASDLGPLMLGAAGLTLISFSSDMVTARGFAAKNHYELDSNQEFIALGVADIGAGLMQGFAVSGADSRTAVNDSVGGKSGVTSLVAAGLLVLVLLFLAGALSFLPITVLAAVLINAALGLFDLKGLLKLRRISRKEFNVSLIATLGVITLGVLPGVVIAVGLAMLLVLIRASSPHDAVLGRLPGGEGFQNIQNHPQAETIPGLMIYRFEAALLFYNSDCFKSRIRAHVKDASVTPRRFLLDAESMPMLDSTGAASLAEIVDELSRQGISFAVARPNERFRLLFERTALKEKIGDGNIFSTIESAVTALQNGGRERGAA
jgi:high affinity sulfate transporter 1